MGVVIDGITVGAYVGGYVGATVGEFVGFCTMGACTVSVNPDKPGEAAKLEDMALVVAELDNDDAIVAPVTDGGTMTVYCTETPTTVAA